MKLNQATNGKDLVNNFQLHFSGEVLNLVPAGKFSIACTILQYNFLLQSGVLTQPTMVKVNYTLNLALHYLLSLNA